MKLEVGANDVEPEGAPPRLQGDHSATAPGPGPGLGAEPFVGSVSCVVRAVMMLKLAGQARAHVDGTRRAKRWDHRTPETHAYLAASSVNQGTRGRDWRTGQMLYETEIHN